MLVTLARDHVYLQSPFLILNDSLADAMKAAALAGIRVWVMIAPRGGEGQLAYRAGMTYARELAEAGVRVLLYQGRVLPRENRVRGLEDLLHRIGEHGHPEFLHQLRDQPCRV